MKNLAVIDCGNYLKQKYAIIVCNIGWEYGVQEPLSIIIIANYAISSV